MLIFWIFRITICRDLIILPFEKISYLNLYFDYYMFLNWAIAITINKYFFCLQSTPVGTSIFRNIKAEDKDAGVNGLVEYFIVESLNGTKSDDTLTSADGFGTFAISFPHQGQVSQFIWINCVFLSNWIGCRMNIRMLNIDLFQKYYFFYKSWFVIVFEHKIILRLVNIYSYFSRRCLIDWNCQQQLD